MPILRVKHGPQKGLEIELNQDNLIIGRDELPGGLQILDQGSSRGHAEVFRIGEVYFIRDLGSRNGTLVNDELRQKLERHCRNLNVPCVSVMDQVLAVYSAFLGRETTHRPGAQHQMDAEYFSRMDAGEQFFVQLDELKRRPTETNTRS